MGDMEVVDQYHLKIAGYLYGSGNKCIYLMDNSPQHKIVNMFVMKFNRRRRIASYSAVDVFGAEKFSVVKIFDDNKVENYLVSVGTQQIGGFIVDTHHDIGNIKVHTLDKSAGRSLQSYLQKAGTRTRCNFKDELGTKVCNMYDKYPSILSVSFGRNLNEQTKWLIFSVGVFVISLKVVGWSRLVNTSVSVWREDLEMAKRKRAILKAAPTFKNLFQIRNIIIAVVGHNSLKNIVYYDIYDLHTCTVLATIEVTPVEDYQGYAQMVVKDSFGSVLCTAIHFQHDELTTLYNNENKLFAYRQHTRIFNINDDPVLELIDLRVTKDQALGTVTKAPLKYMIPTSGFRLAEECSARTGGRQLANCEFTSQQKFTYSQLMEILVLSTHRELSMLSPGKPIPEIEYFYFNDKQANRSYLS